MTGLSVVNLSVPFGPAAGLTAISFVAGRGECLALVGASGAGKTSLLRAIAGLSPIGGGQVSVADRDVTAEPAERRQAVYLHQTPRLFPHLSVAENVAFPLRIRRVDRREAGRIVGHALDLVRLGHLADRRPQTLSGGQRQRVALARALAARPAVLLLDEPLAALDPALRQEVRQAVADLRDSGTVALVLVTHDFDEASLLADRVGVLLHGGMAQLAPPDELFSRPASLAVATFLGFPNVIPGHMNAAGEFRSPLGLVRPPRPCRAGAAVAVARADGLHPDGQSGAIGTVERLLCRAQRTSAVVAVGSLRLEVAVDAAAPPTPGTTIGLRLDPRQLSVFPDRP